MCGVLGLAGAALLAGCEPLLPPGGFGTASPAAEPASGAADGSGGPTVVDTVAASTAGSSAGSTVPPPSAAALAALVTQANWILSCQMTDGALAPVTVPPVPSVFVSPYLANYGAMGLARATAVTGDSTYAAAAWRWLAWYAGQEQPGTGYVEDANVANTGQVQEAVSPSGAEDSTDAYAGTFLLAALDTEQADPDPGALAALAPAIAGALDAIQSTQQPDGLTWAKPSYQAAYLMDQSEAFAGLEAAGLLESALGNTTLESSADASATSMAGGVGSLWDGASGGFAWAAFPDGATTGVDWHRLYPDTMEEAWAVAFGLATPAQGTAIADAMTADEPQWDQPDAMASMAGNGLSAAGDWPLAAWALEEVGQVGAGEAAAASIWQVAQTAQYWPYNIAVAAQLIVAESGGPAMAGVSPA